MCGLNLFPLKQGGGPPRPLMQSGPRGPMQGPGGPRGPHPHFRPPRHMIGMGRPGFRPGGPRFPGGMKKENEMSKSRFLGMSHAPLPWG